MHVRATRSSARVVAATVKPRALAVGRSPSTASTAGAAHDAGSSVPPYSAPAPPTPDPSTCSCPPLRHSHCLLLQCVVALAFDSVLLLFPPPRQPGSTLLTTSQAVPAPQDVAAAIALSAHQEPDPRSPCHIPVRDSPHPQASCAVAHLPERSRVSAAPTSKKSCGFHLGAGPAARTHHMGR